VDERAAQRYERPGQGLAVVDLPGGRDGAPKALDTRLDRSGGEGGFAGFDLRQNRGSA
jgi:hypothetical protein